jgi:hypothetical protein
MQRMSVRCISERWIAPRRSSRRSAQMDLYSVLYTYPGSNQLRELIVRATGWQGAKLKARLRLTYPNIVAAIRL